MDKNKEGRITIANIVTIIGLVAFAICSFFGLFYKSGGEIGKSILLAIAYSAVAALLVWLMVKSKGAENSFNLWRGFEIGTGILYVCFAAFTAIYLLKCFSVNGQKAGLQRIAAKDIEIVNDYISSYEDYEDNRISLTISGLENVASFAENKKSPKLQEYINRNSISLANIDNSKDFWTSNLLGDKFKNLRTNCDNNVSKFQSMVVNWNMFKTISSAKQLEASLQAAEKGFVQMSEGEELPIIVSVSTPSGTSEYDIQKMSPSWDKHANPLEFRTAVMESKNTTVLSWIFLIFVHLAILANYIFGYRSNKVAISRATVNDGGHTLE